MGLWDRFKGLGKAVGLATGLLMANGCKEAPATQHPDAVQPAEATRAKVKETVKSPSTNALKGAEREKLSQLLTPPTPPKGDRPVQDSPKPATAAKNVPAAKPPTPPPPAKIAKTPKISPRTYQGPLEVPKPEGYYAQIGDEVRKVLKDEYLPPKTPSKVALIGGEKRKPSNVPLIDDDIEELPEGDVKLRPTPPKPPKPPTTPKVKRITEKPAVVASTEAEPLSMPGTSGAKPTPTPPPTPKATVASAKKPGSSTVQQQEQKPKTTASKPKAEDEPFDNQWIEAMLTDDDEADSEPATSNATPRIISKEVDDEWCAIIDDMTICEDETVELGLADVEVIDEETDGDNDPPAILAGVDSRATPAPSPDPEDTPPPPPGPENGELQRLLLLIEENRRLILLLLGLLAAAYAAHRLHQHLRQRGLAQMGTRPPTAHPTGSAVSVTAPTLPHATDLSFGGSTIEAGPGASVTGVSMASGTAETVFSPPKRPKTLRIEFASEELGVDLGLVEMTIGIPKNIDSHEARDLNTYIGRLNALLERIYILKQTKDPTTQRQYVRLNGQAKIAASLTALSQERDENQGGTNHRFNQRLYALGAGLYQITTAVTQLYEQTQASLQALETVAVPEEIEEMDSEFLTEEAVQKEDEGLFQLFDPPGEQSPQTQAANQGVDVNPLSPTRPPEPDTVLADPRAIRIDSIPQDTGNETGRFVFKAPDLKPFIRKLEEAAQAVLGQIDAYQKQLDGLQAALSKLQGKEEPLLTEVRGLLEQLSSVHTDTGYHQILNKIVKESDQEPLKPHTPDANPRALLDLALKVILGSNDLQEADLPPAEIIRRHGKKNEELIALSGRYKGAVERKADAHSVIELKIRTLETLKSALASVTESLPMFKPYDTIRRLNRQQRAIDHLRPKYVTLEAELRKLVKVEVDKIEAFTPDPIRPEPHVLAERVGSFVERLKAASLEDDAKTLGDDLRGLATQCADALRFWTSQIGQMESGNKALEGRIVQIQSGILEAKTQHKKRTEEAMKDAETKVGDFLTFHRGKETAIARVVASIREYERLYSEITQYKSFLDQTLTTNPPESRPQEPDFKRIEVAMPTNPVFLSTQMTNLKGRPLEPSSTRRPQEGDYLDELIGEAKKITTTATLAFRELEALLAKEEEIGTMIEVAKAHLERLRGQLRIKLEEESKSPASNERRPGILFGLRGRK